MFIGASDSGKTTLVKSLLEAFRRRGLTVSLVDADLGQSQIGPPTTIGYLPSDKCDKKGDKQLFPPHIHFLGDTTPAGKIETAAWYTAHCIHKGRESAQVVLVDTCGYLGCREAEQMKILQAEWGKVDLVIALGEKKEFSFLDKVQVSSILVLPPPTGVRGKTSQQRKVYRETLFREYFSRVRFQHVHLSCFSFRPPDLPPGIICEIAPRSFFPEIPSGKELCTFRGLVCGLWNKRGLCFGLGRLRWVEHNTGRALFAIPEKLDEAVYYVVPGVLRVGPGGNELGRLD